MIRVTGPARPLGLAGFYLIILNQPPGGWMTTPFTVEVAIRKDSDFGQAFASFAEETQQFRIEAGGQVRDSFEILLKVLSAYEAARRDHVALFHRKNVETRYSLLLIWSRLSRRRGRPGFLKERTYGVIPQPPHLKPVTLVAMQD